MEWDMILQRYVWGELSEEERASLELELEHSPELRATLEAYVRLHSALEDISKQGVTAPDLSRSIERRVQLASYLRGMLQLCGGVVASYARAILAMLGLSR
ncbi:hypothetical protein Tter_2631 [Thermobaculum terrenum ATCC BAA-798]|uniref:Zinc-finger domain-containing protein n=1 Tax=Thermobaculum terrenum (strain ATCC BAA-798 / CCMEE 7001 / YNP1) TaxID=525904 RepID=D1CIE8_THET1|nr:hypothetical protein [Thermobaculum terrenum]ACZ43519.1 hypothetical protein Tter_2631 [Thermobaculum terrenum ATCC BAA-798]